VSDIVFTFLVVAKLTLYQCIMYPKRKTSDMEIIELENQILKLKVRLFENDDAVRQKNILIQNLNSDLQYCQKQFKIICIVFFFITYRKHLRKNFTILLVIVLSDKFIKISISFIRRDYTNAGSIVATELNTWNATCVIVMCNSLILCKMSLYGSRHMHSDLICNIRVRYP